MFIPAIGIDDLIIPNLELRAAILSTLEAASVLELLLRAEALTAAAPCRGADGCWAGRPVRCFLEALKSPAFLDQQASAWAISKFHMLMHVINGTSCAGLLELVALRGVLRLSSRASESSRRGAELPFATSSSTTSSAWRTASCERGEGRLPQRFRARPSPPGRASTRGAVHRRRCRCCTGRLRQERMSFLHLQ